MVESATDIELISLPLDAILDLARSPAPFDVPAQTRHSDHAAADWQAAAEAVAREAEAKSVRRAAGNVKPTLNRTTLDFIRNGANQGDRHRLLFSAAANLAEFGCPPALAFALLAESALDSGLPPKEVHRQIECGLSALSSDTTRQDAPESAQDTLDDATVKEPQQGDGNDSGNSQAQSCQQVTTATVRSGIRSAAEDVVIDHQTVPLAEHIDAYLTKLEADGTSAAHRVNVRRNLKRLVADCQLKRLASLSRETLERWLVVQAKAGMGPRTRNTYRAAAVAFGNWCVETGRLLANPFAKVAKAVEEADRRRQRRALTEVELRRLLDVARKRPLLDTMTVRRGRRKGEAVANLRHETRRRLERLGHERALIYKTLVLTGLRKGELASLTVGQLNLDADPPFLVLDAANEKNREGKAELYRGPHC